MALSKLVLIWPSQNFGARNPTHRLKVFLRKSMVFYWFSQGNSMVFQCPSRSYSTPSGTLQKRSRNLCLRGSTERAWRARIFKFSCSSQAGHPSHSPAGLAWLGPAWFSPAKPGQARYPAWPDPAPPARRPARLGSVRTATLSNQEYPGVTRGSTCV